MAEKNLKEKIIRLVNSNFSKKDMWATLTYSNEKKPASEKQAEIKTSEFIHRLEKWMEENEGKKPLKYVCVTHSNQGRLHCHIITNFPNKEEVLEKLWSGGGRMQARRLTHDEYGHEGLVRYMLNGHVENSLITNISE